MSIAGRIEEQIAAAVTPLEERVEQLEQLVAKLVDRLAPPQEAAAPAPAKKTAAARPATTRGKTGA